MWSSISVVIPVYNSSDSLDELTGRLTSHLSRICYQHEIIMVNDGSKDNSYQTMLKLHEQDRRVKVIDLDGNFGQQNALICGFNYAKGDYIVTLDDDLQHLPEEIERLLLVLDRGYDIVYGIPAEKHHSFYRRLGSRLTWRLFNLITSKPADIKISSFRVFRKELLKKVITHKTSFVYISAIIFKYTNNIGNVIIKHNTRKYGKSNYNFIKLCKLFLKLYIYYSESPFLKIFTSSRPQFLIKDIRL